MEQRQDENGGYVMNEKRIGTADDGTAIYSWQIRDEDGNTAELTNYGATLLSFVAGADGGKRDIVLGYEAVQDYFGCDSCMGAVVGRNANRIGGAAFDLNGQHYTLKANDGANNLHSGGEGFQYRCWNMQSCDGHSITFEIESPDMDCGFPGTLTMSVTYSMDHGALLIDYKGRADKDTIFNPTSHGYFNLDGQGNGTILEHTLQINASELVVGGEDSIPRGELRTLAGTPFDFAETHRIGERIDADYDELRFANGYDHCYALMQDARNRSERFSLEGVDVFRAAELTSSDGTLHLNVYTSSVGMHLYTGNFLDGTLPGKDGAVYGKHSGVAMESEYFPNAINVPSFASPVLKAGEVRQLRTVYEVKA